MIDNAISQKYRELYQKKPLVTLYGTAVVFGLFTIGLYLISIQYLPVKMTYMEVLILGLGASVMAVVQLIALGLILFVSLSAYFMASEINWYQTLIAPLSEEQKVSQQRLMFILAGILIPILSINFEIKMKSDSVLWYSLLFSLALIFCISSVTLFIQYWLKKIPLFLATIDSIFVLLIISYAGWLMYMTEGYMGKENLHRILMAIYLVFFLILAFRKEISVKTIAIAYTLSIIVVEVSIGWGVVHKSVLGTFTVTNLNIANLSKAQLHLSHDGCIVFQQYPDLNYSSIPNNDCIVSPVEIQWRIGEETVIKVSDENNISHRVYLPSKNIKNIVLPY